MTIVTTNADGTKTTFSIHPKPGIAVVLNTVTGYVSLVANLKFTKVGK
jgi:hypothetical protein